MLSDASVKRIGCEVFRIAQEFKFCLWDDEMQITGLRADRTFAIRALEALRRLDFEANSAAVTTAAINHGSPFPNENRAKLARWW
jgi:hypothetical protein